MYRRFLGLSQAASGYRGSRYDASWCKVFLFLLQIVVQPGQGQAQQSSLAGLQPFLIAGLPQQLAITARDAHGNLTAGTDCVEVLLDSTAEGAMLDKPPCTSAHCCCNLSAQLAFCCFMFYAC